MDLGFSDDEGSNFNASGINFLRVCNTRRIGVKVIRLLVYVQKAFISALVISFKTCQQTAESFVKALGSSF